MEKYKTEIEFHDKKMNLLEAKLYLFKLKWRIIKANLNKEEIEDYSKWEDKERIRNKKFASLLKEKISLKLNEREYLIQSLENKIKSTKTAQNKAYCEENGHKEKKGSDYCPRCGMPYEASKKAYNPFQG